MGTPVDIVDLKEPSRGSLGGVDPQIARGVAELLGDCQLSSIAVGELEDLEPGVEMSWLAGFDYAKVGLANTVGIDWRVKLERIWQGFPIGTEPVAVFYADSGICQAPGFDEVFHFAYDQDCSAILIDTYDKSQSRGLFDWLTADQVRELLARCQATDLQVAIAGSLTTADLPVICRLDPDYVAVRSAICLAGSRTNQVSSRAICEFHSLLNEMVAAR